MDVLNHSPNMQIVIDKLPLYLQNKWRDCAMRLCESQDGVTFSNIVQFVHDAAKSANHPVFSREAMKGIEAQKSGAKTSSSNKSKYFPQKSKTSSFPIKTEKVAEPQKSSGLEKKTADHKRSCHMCKRDHDLDDCDKFAKRTSEEKIDFLSEADIMKRFEHKNIVRLLGVCTRNEPVYTVMEYMLYG